MSGTARPTGLEWLLNGATWDADALRDQVRAYVLERLGHPEAVLVADDTRAIKRGTKSAGVARQYCGATGQVENCQVMPMLTYASPLGHAFIDRRLHLPESRCGDPGRMAEAGVPAQVAFATKPHLVIGMLEGAITAGAEFSFFTAGSGYGRDPALRGFRHERAIAYVMAVPVDLPLTGSRRQAIRPDQAGGRLTGADFERRSCGHGTKGGRYYDWAAAQVTVKDQTPAGGFEHLLLVRRSATDPKDVGYFLAHAPAGTPISRLIAAAGTRWKIEENNGHGKDLLGLDRYQVRKWTPWHRHITTCMLAAAFLAATRAALGKETQPREQEAPTAR